MTKNSERLALLAFTVKILKEKPSVGGPAAASYKEDELAFYNVRNKKMSRRYFLVRNDSILSAPQPHTSYVVVIVKSVAAKFNLHISSMAVANTISVGHGS